MIVEWPGYLPGETSKLIKLLFFLLPPVRVIVQPECSTCAYCV